MLIICEMKTCFKRIGYYTQRKATIDRHSNLVSKCPLFLSTLLWYHSFALKIFTNFMFWKISITASWFTKLDVFVQEHTVVIVACWCHFLIKANYTIKSCYAILSSPHCYVLNSGALNNVCMAYCQAVVVYNSNIKNYHWNIHFQSSFL